MSKPRVDPTFGISSVDVLILTERHPACRRREAQPGSCKERENLAGDAKGKGSSGANRKAESTDAPERGGLLRSSEEAAVMVVERRGRAIDDEIGPTGNGRSPKFNGRRQPSTDGTSRMMREYQVRICERLGVKFPGPTRQSRHFGRRPTTSGLPLETDIPRAGPHVSNGPQADIGTSSIISLARSRNEKFTGAPARRWRWRWRWRWPCISNRNAQPARATFRRTPPMSAYPPISTRL
jgi:hypothetical protein